MPNVISIANSHIGKRSRLKLFRVVLAVNFIGLLLLVGPGNSHSLYVAEKRMGIAEVVTGAVQFRFVSATVIMTVLFISMLRSKANPSQPRPTRLDWGLFLIWWVIVVALCLFAFMMGMGG